VTVAVGRLTDPRSARFSAVSVPGLACNDLTFVAADLMSDVGYPNLCIPIVDVRDIAIAHPRKMTSAKAQRVLGWQARERQDAILAAGESMIAKGLITQPLTK
jgi:hypothetical protein